ncbi:MAG: hypothetical protein E7220_07455 [Clostridiales bacterium]|nr:hypothetical protein [Clostridiales bacterium]
MNKKSNAAAVVAYLTWIGWFVALIIRDKNDPFTTHHLNQALILNILSIIGGAINALPLLGGIVAGLIDLVILFLWAVGVYRAVTWSDDPLPLIGNIHLIG